MSEEEDSESDYSEIEDEPKLKYRRIGNDILALLRNTSITAFVSNERLIALGTADGSVGLFDHEGNKIQDVWKHNGKCTCIVMDDRGELIGSSGEDGSVKVTSLFGDEEREQKMKFRSEVFSLALAPDYKDTGRIVIGSDKITLCEKGLLGSKKSSTLAVGIQGAIAKLDWKYPEHIVWADTKDVKIFDLGKREVISIIPRQSSGLNSSHFRANFFWNDKNQLIIAWGDYVQICQIKNRAGTRKVEIQKMCQTTFKCSGVSQLGDDLMVLSYEEDLKPAVRIITPNVSNYDEVAFDTLTMREYTSFKSRDYILTKNDDLNNYFIVSPKDIIVAVEPDDEDHLNWLLENEQYVEALDFCQGRKFKDHTYGSIGREYIRYLISDDQLSSAAEKCRQFLFTFDEWEREAMAFSSKSALKTLVPYLPTSEPTLRASIYGEALREFIESKEYDQYLHWIETWPSAIYEIKQQVYLIRKELEHKKNRSLTIALRILLENDQKYREAFQIFLQLRDTSIFDFIERRLLYREDWLKEYTLHLMKLDSGKCTDLFVNHNFEIKPIVEILKTDTRLLYSYLHSLYVRDNKLPAELHDLQVLLYACYDRPKLLPFLKTSTHYEEREALKIVRNKSYQEEEVYLLARMGAKSEALNLLLKSADSISKAVEFCRDQADHELWLELIDLSITNPAFVKDLLNTVGSHVDPLIIIERIPAGMEIPGLRDALQIVLHDATERRRMWHSAEKISSQDGLGLIKKMYRQRAAGVYIDKGNQAKCNGCSSKVIEQQGLRGGRLLMFGCGHIAHGTCSIDHSKHQVGWSSPRTTRLSINSVTSTEKCPACERSS